MLNKCNSDIEVAESSILQLRIKQGEELQVIRDNASHGQIEEAYRVAGVSQKQASESSSVLNLTTSYDLPKELGFSVAVECAKKNTPEPAIQEILDNPTVTVREAKEIIKKHKPDEPKNFKPFKPSDP